MNDLMTETLNVKGIQITYLITVYISLSTIIKGFFLTVKFFF